MSPRIEIGDPVQYAAVASQILRAAWKPPCLHYSSEYLAWQFSFPSDVPKHAAIAFLENRPVGCIAVTSRRFSYARESFSAYVLSFVGVDPSASRRGIAAALYESLLEALPLDVPVFAFAEPESIGERLLLSSFRRAAFRHHPLQACRAVGYLRRSTASATAGLFVQETMTYDEFASLGRSSAAQDLIQTDITREHWHHYRDDPRGRVMVAVRNADGNLIGTAMLVAAETVSSDGVQRVPMLEGVTLSDPRPDALSALFRFAAGRSQPGAIVVASNLSYIDAAVVKAAGPRALPSSFSAHVFVRGEEHVVETAAALNLEVI